MNRLNTITQKVPTRFGSLYAHVSHDPRDRSGRVVEVAFSTPGRVVNTAVSDAIIALGEATTEAITVIDNAAREHANGTAEEHW